ncbi:MAG: hypothetical protein KBT01_04420 [Clostridiales bacterium]|nr:hypothetical protein [Candidatus Blautia equi]
MKQLPTRAEIVETLLKSYKRYYNITLSEEEPLVARCEYFEHSEKYVLHRKAELWSADNEEFLYLFQVPHLTAEIFEKCRTFAYEDGMPRLNIGPGHMASAITVVVVCDTCDAEAETAVKKTRIHKSFHFSLHGWMNVLTTCVAAENGRMAANYAGRSVMKVMKKVLYS